MMNVSLTKDERTILLYVLSYIEYAADPLKDTYELGNDEPADAYAALKSMSKKVRLALALGADVPSENMSGRVLCGITTENMLFIEFRRGEAQTLAWATLPPDQAIAHHAAVEEMLADIGQATASVSLLRELVRLGPRHDRQLCEPTKDDQDRWDAEYASIVERAKRLGLVTE